MASAIIHLCVAKKVNSYLQMDERHFSLGAIAPDMAKIVGMSKNKSHFLNDEENEDTPPHYERFISKYKDDLNKPFEMGYLVHLMTDYYWFKDYVYQYINKYTNNKNTTYTALKEIIYNDYTSLNQDLIDDYMLDLYYFQNEIELPKSKIDEIPMDKMQLLIDKMGILIKNMGKNKPVMMNEKEIILFIESCSNSIIRDLKKMNLIGDNYEK
ncbi:MAG: zinc dependent phospholipase C family protein [Bacilli bacterium]|nr:zinc dependent phospholipase C family protein [Bacilli bacterium]